MSTRCNIVITDEKTPDLFLYHHHDGYPEGVGVDLMKSVFKLIAPAFWETDDKERNDFYYLSKKMDVANALLKNKEDDGYELTSDYHGDIEYIYNIDVRKKRITCFKAILLNYGDEVIRGEQVAIPCDEYKEQEIAFEKRQAEEDFKKAEELEKKSVDTAESVTAKTAEFIETDNFFQVKFSAKPSAEVLENLKKNGFKWFRCFGYWGTFKNGRKAEEVKQALNFA